MISSNKRNVHSLPLTIVLVQNPKTERYTVFSKQFPNILAEGEDEENAINNLFEVMYVAFKDQATDNNEIFKEKYCISEKEFTLTMEDA